MMNTRAALRKIWRKLLCFGLFAVTIYALVVMKSAPTVRQEK